MQILRSHPRPTESEALREGRVVCSTSHPGYPDAWSGSSITGFRSLGRYLNGGLFTVAKLETDTLSMLEFPGQPVRVNLCSVLCTSVFREVLDWPNYNKAGKIALHMLGVLARLQFLSVASLQMAT